MELEWEALSGQLRIAVSASHRFGTDAFLLTAFSQYKEKDIVCDLGTGCGIIPMLMERNRPPRQITAVDIQREAIALLTETVAANALTNLCPVCADLKTLWADAPRAQCSLVTCNPPYKAANAGIESALTPQKIARHEILCNIYDVCAAAASLLKYGGRLCICNRPERLCDVVSAMRQSGIEPKRLRFVSKNAAAAPWLFLIEGRKGGGAFLRVEPPLFVRSEQGYSTELEQIYRMGLE